MTIKKLIIIVSLLLNISMCFSNSILKQGCKEVWTTVNQANNIELYRMSLLMCVDTNQISTQPQNIISLHSNTSNITNTTIQTLPHNISNITNITNTTIHSIPYNISNITNSSMQTLPHNISNITNTTIHAIPHNISNITNTTIHTIPHNISNVNNISNITNTTIHTIPHNISNVNNITNTTKINNFDDDDDVMNRSVTDLNYAYKNQKNMTNTNNVDNNPFIFVISFLFLASIIIILIYKHGNFKQRRFTVMPEKNEIIDTLDDDIENNIEKPIIPDKPNNLKRRNTVDYLKEKISLLNMANTLLQNPGIKMEEGEYGEAIITDIEKQESPKEIVKNQKDSLKIVTNFDNTPRENAIKQIGGVEGDNEWYKNTFSSELNEVSMCTIEGEKDNTIMKTKKDLVFSSPDKEASFPKYKILNTPENITKINNHIVRDVLEDIIDKVSKENRPKLLIGPFN